ncbi:hypothetical protein ABE099_00875 [Paenibacillus turicensis]
MLSEFAKGRAKEINLASWNDKELKYDMKSWIQREKMYEEITLSKE